MNIKMLKAAVAGLILSVSSFASAGLIIEKSLDTTNYGWNANVNGTSQQSTDFFMLTQTSSVSSVEWYGFRDAGLNFSIRFFDNITAGNNTSFFYEDLVLATAIGTGIIHNSYEIFKYSANITELTLLSNKNYYLAVNSTSASTWVWNFSAPSGNDLFHRNGDADTWREISSLGRDSHAFSLHGDAVSVPEPSTLVIFALGIMGLASRRLKKQ